MKIHFNLLAEKNTPEMRLKKKNTFEKVRRNGSGGNEREERAD